MGADTAQDARVPPGGMGAGVRVRDGEAGPEHRSGSPFARPFTAEQKARFVPFIVGEPGMLTVPEGGSLDAMIELAIAEGAISRAVASAPSLTILVGGVEVPRQHWRWVRPKRADLVMVRVRAQGGRQGKSVLRMVLMLAVTAFAFWAAPAAAIALGFSGTGFVSGLIGGAITLAGNALVNAIAPIPQQSLPQRSQSYSFTGSQNQLKPFAPCTIVLGEHRMVPAYCLQWHTSMYGDSVIFYGLFQWHVGKCEVDDLKIGETPFEDFLYAGRQDRLLGEPYDPGVYDLIPNVVKEVQEQLELKADNGWENRRFPRNASELSFDLAFPGGLNDGEGGPTTVNLECQYRKVGDAGWTDLPDSANASYMTGAGDIEFDDEYYSMLRRTFRWTPYDAPGDYEMRIRRTTADDLTLADDVWVACMRTHRPDLPVTNDDVCVTAVFLTATNQVSGVIDQLNGVVRGLYQLPDGLGGWTDFGTSRNPAAHLYWLHTGPAVAPALRLDGSIFDDTLLEFYDYCEAADLTCDHVVDYGPSVEDLAQTIASCGNAHIGWERGKRRVVIDTVKQPTQLFTASTVRGFRGNIVYSNAVHALKATFLNEEKGWEPDECIAYADGYDASTAVNIESAEVPGKTRFSDVWRTLRRILKRGDIRFEGASFDTDFEFLETRFGDRAYVEHFAMQGGTQSGHIRAVTLDGSDATGVTLDEIVTLDGGMDYGIRFRRVSDGALVTAPVVNPMTALMPRLTSDAAPRLLSDGTPRMIAVSTGLDELEFVTPLTGDDVPAEGDLYAFGPITEIGMDCSIISIKPARDDTATITVVPYSDTAFSDDADVADYRVLSDGSIRFMTDGNPRRMAA